MRINIILFGCLFLGLVACNENAVDKVKKKNVQLANKRELKIGNKASKIKFEKISHDFGTIKEGDIVETVFKFTNTGNSDLIITNAKASCGCTIPKWPKQPIKPGEEDSIRVVFNSRGKRNKQQKTITLATNTEKGNEMVLIRAFVKPKINK